MEYKIDASEKILGRLASQAALLLRGKNDPRFDPARLSGNRVIIHHTDEVRVTGRKSSQKLYRRHSGYPGGLKEESLTRLLRRDSRLAVRRAIMGMLPKNRLRRRMIKNLALFRVKAGHLQ